MDNVKKQWEGDRFLNDLKKKLPSLGNALGIFWEGEAVSRVSVKTGALKDSIKHEYEITADSLIVRVGSNLEYAAIQEFGGDIKPDKAGALTIPIHPDAKNKRAPDFPDLFIVKTDTNTFLARKKGKKGIEFLFLLVKKATIPARPFIGPVLYSNADRIESIIIRALGVKR